MPFFRFCVPKNVESKGSKFDVFPAEAQQTYHKQQRKSSFAFDKQIDDNNITTTTTTSSDIEPSFWFILMSTNDYSAGKGTGR